MLKLQPHSILCPRCQEQWLVVDSPRLVPEHLTLQSDPKGRQVRLPCRPKALPQEDRRQVLERLLPNRPPLVPDSKCPAKISYRSSKSPPGKR